MVESDVRAGTTVVLIEYLGTTEGALTTEEQEMLAWEMKNDLGLTTSANNATSIQIGDLTVPVEGDVIAVLDVTAVNNTCKFPFILFHITRQYSCFDKSHITFVSDKHFSG